MSYAQDLLASRLAQQAKKAVKLSADQMKARVANGWTHSIVNALGSAGRPWRMQAMREWGSPLRRLLLEDLRKWLSGL